MISSTEWRWNKALLSTDSIAFLTRSCTINDIRSVGTEYLEVEQHPLYFIIPLNTLFVISFHCRSGYTLVGKAKNMPLISMDSGYGDENPFVTKSGLNLIEGGSRVLKEKFGESIKSTWFTDSRTTLQGRFWRDNITMDRKVENPSGYRARRDTKNVRYGLQVRLSR